MNSPDKRRLLSRGLLAPFHFSVSPLVLILLTPFFLCILTIIQPMKLSPSMKLVHTIQRRPRMTIRHANATSQEKPAVIAYGLQISKATVGHLPRLFERLYHPLNIHVLHFDVKIPDDEVNLAMKEIYTRVPDHKTNTHVVPRQLVTYDGVSIILNTLSLMSFLLNEVSQPWDFFINLSGSDYPLVRPDVPRKLLGKALPYRPLFFSFAARERWQSAFREWASSFHIDDALTHQRTAGELWHVRARNPLVDRLHFTPAYGEAWMIVPREFCRYVTVADEARKMLLTVGNMRGGDEHFFVTLAVNHARFNASIIANSLRKVVWRFEGKQAGQHPFYLDERSDDGESFRFLELLRRSIALHARKFKEADSEFMDMVDVLAKDEGRTATTEKAFAEMLAGLRQRQMQSNESLGTSQNIV